jgi:hypothetical protein
MELFKNEDFTVRGKNSILCGTLIASYIKEMIKISHEEVDQINLSLNEVDNGSISVNFSSKRVIYKNLPNIPIDDLISELFNCLVKEPNSLGIKMIIQSFEIFLPLCIYLPSQQWNIPSLLLKFVDLKNTFWSVKVQV